MLSPRRPFFNLSFPMQPITIAFVAGGSIDSPTYTVLVQRIVGTLVGAVAALFIVQLVNANIVATGVVVTLWVGLMSYPRSKGASGYWAVVSAFTTAIIVFATVSTEGARQLLELRVLYTVLGIAVYTLVSQVVFPVSARDLAHTSTLAAVTAIRTSQRETIGQLTRFLREEAARARQRLEAEGVLSALPEAEAPFLRGYGASATPTASAATGASAGGTAAAGTRVPTAHEADPTARLDSVTASMAALPELLTEAEAEPTLWRAPFARMRSRYTELSTQLERASRNVRTVHQALLGLRAQALVFEQRRRAADAAAATAGATSTSASAARPGSAIGSGGGSVAAPAASPGRAPEPTPLRAETLALPIAGLRLQSSAPVQEVATRRAGKQSSALLSASAAVGAAADIGPLAGSSEHAIRMNSVAAAEPGLATIGRAARASPAAYDSGNRDAADRGVLIFSSLLLQLEPLATSLDEVYRHVAVVLAPDEQLHDMLKEAAAAELEAIGQPADETEGQDDGDGDGEGGGADDGGLGARIGGAARLATGRRPRLASGATASALPSVAGSQGGPSAVPTATPSFLRGVADVPLRELPRPDLAADGVTSAGSAYAEAVRAAATPQIPDPEEGEGEGHGIGNGAGTGEAPATQAGRARSESVSRIHKRLSQGADTRGRAGSSAAAASPSRGVAFGSPAHGFGATADAAPQSGVAAAPSGMRRRGLRLRRPSALLGTGVAFGSPDAAHRLRAIDSLRLSSMTLLPAAVETTSTRLQAYLDSYDAFLRAYSVAIVQQSADAEAHAAAAAASAPAAASAAASSAGAGLLGVTVPATGAGAAPAPSPASAAGSTIPAAVAVMRSGLPSVEPGISPAARPGATRLPAGLAPILSPPAGGPGRRRAGTYVPSMAGPVLIPDAPGDLLSPGASSSSSGGGGGDSTNPADIGSRNDNGNGDGLGLGGSTGTASPVDRSPVGAAASPAVQMPVSPASESPAAPIAAPTAHGSRGTAALSGAPEALPEPLAERQPSSNSNAQAAANSESRPPTHGTGHEHVHVQLAQFPTILRPIDHHRHHYDHPHEHRHHGDDHGHSHEHHRHHHDRPQLAISNVDALCFSVVSFALHELVESAAEVAACARRLRHAQDDAFAKL